MFSCIFKALSKALTELRADMVTQAQEQVKAHAEDSEGHINVQKIVDKHTRELTVSAVASLFTHHCNLMKITKL